MPAARMRWVFLGSTDDVAAALEPCLPSRRHSAEEPKAKSPARLRTEFGEDVNALIVDFAVPLTHTTTIIINFVKVASRS